MAGEFRPDTYYLFLEPGHTLTLGKNQSEEPFQLCYKTDLTYMFSTYEKPAYLATVTVPTDEEFDTVQLRAKVIDISDIQPVMKHPEWDRDFDDYLIRHYPESFSIYFPEKMLRNISWDTLRMLSQKKLLTRAHYQAIASSIWNNEKLDFFPEGTMEDPEFYTEEMLKSNPDLYLHHPVYDPVKCREVILSRVCVTGKFPMKEDFSHLTPLEKFVYINKSHAARNLRHPIDIFKYADFGSAVWIPPEIFVEFEDAMFNSPYAEIDPWDRHVTRTCSRKFLNRITDRLDTFNKGIAKLGDFVRKFVKSDEFLTKLQSKGMLKAIYGGIIREAFIAILTDQDPHEVIYKYRIDSDVDIYLHDAIYLLDVVNSFGGAIGYRGHRYTVNSDGGTVKDRETQIYCVWIPHEGGFLKYDVTVGTPDYDCDFTINGGIVYTRNNCIQIEGFKPCNMDALINRKLILAWPRSVISGEFGNIYKLMARMSNMLSRGYTLTKETAAVCKLVLRKVDRPWYRRIFYVISTVLRKPPMPDARHFNVYRDIPDIVAERVWIDERSIDEFITDDFRKAVDDAFAEWGEAI